MVTRERIAAIVAGAGLCCIASAQDSIGRTASGTGTAAVKDNIGAYDTAQFQRNYVVDLVDITSSWGNVFHIGPIAKSSNASNGSAVTSAFVNATALSSTQLDLNIVTSPPYAMWADAGAINAKGVNNVFLANGPVNDTPDGLLAVEGPVKRLGFAFIERNSGGATGNTTYTGMIGGLIDYYPSDPTRLYVSRIEGASNNTAAGPITASFGLGGVDSHGNVAMRIDGNGADATNPRTIGPTTGQSNNNYVRVDLKLRDASFNWARWTRVTPTPPGQLTDPVDLTAPLLSQTGVDVGRGILSVTTGQPVNVNCPNIAPQQVAGRPIVLGSGFDLYYKYESAPGVLSSTQAHFNALNNDHRGNCNYTFRNFFPGSVAGTGAFIGFASSPISSRAGDAISVTAFGLDANGAPTGEYLFALPDASLGLGMTDPYGINGATGQPFNTAADFPLPPGVTLPVFFLYQGNTAFAGGAGQIGVGVDPAGKLMVAGTVSANSPPGSDPTATDRRNYIAVGRTASGAGPTEWVCAAWVNSPSGSTDPTAASGKDIVDASGAVVGQLTTFSDYRSANGGIAFTSTSQGGPSFSAPAFDSVGNVYFIAGARLSTPSGTVKRLCLIRGVRQESPFGYKLEKVLAEGDVIHGANSGANYRISGLNLTAMNTAAPPAGPNATGIANGTLWSNATNQEAAAGADRAALATSDPRTLGGIVLSASITYDENGNGSFADATDQNYQALLYINGAVAVTPQCRADFNGDGDINPDDLGDFITCYFNEPPCPGADFNNDTNVDPDDLGDYITTYFSGGCG